MKSDKERRYRRLLSPFFYFFIFFLVGETFKPLRSGRAGAMFLQVSATVVIPTFLSVPLKLYPFPLKVMRTELLKPVFITFV